ncbi:MAG: non-ribosomal peptide synthetase, partial [bacterium]|nr:non-ribosomal peptide synthetase [bacterium]
MKRVDKKNIETVFSLTPLQEGLLFHFLEDPDSRRYFEQLSLEVSGEIHRDRFERAWDFVVRTNQMLRTLFRWETLNEPTQVVLKSHSPDIRYHDISNPDETGTNREQRLRELKRNDKQELFDLQEVPFRITLIKREQDRYVIFISNHHILYDGWSTGIILKEFFNAYHCLTDGQELIKPLKTGFKEFIKWNRDRDAANIRGREKFWRDYLKGFDTPTRLTAGPSKDGESGSPGRLKVTFEKEIESRTREFIRRHKITPAALLYGAWGALLQRYTNSTDVVFGTTVSGRTSAIKGIEDVVGLFINTLPLRVQTQSDNPGSSKTTDWLQHINNTLQTREPYENTPLVEVREYSELSPGGELFDSIMVIENYPLDRRLEQQNSPLTVESYSIFEMTHYDLVVAVNLYERIELEFSYIPNRLEEETARRLGEHFSRVIEEIALNTPADVTMIDLLTEEEKQRILRDFNDTASVYPKDKTMHQLFE